MPLASSTDLLAQTLPLEGRARPTLSELLLDLPDGVQQGRLIELFREALRRREAPTLPLLRGRFCAPLACTRCLDGATKSLGYTLEPQTPLPGEEAIFFPYEYVSWYTQNEEALTRERLTQVKLHDSVRYGLFRLIPQSAKPSEEVWFWVHEAGQVPSPDDEVVWAIPGREPLNALLQEAYRLHALHDRERAGLILLGNTRETRSPTREVTWDDVLLPERLRSDLKRTVSEFFANGELYRRHGLPHRRGVLLAGPPGNGKTTIIKAIAHEVGHPMIVAVLDDPNSGLYNCRNAFERAAELAPAVVCFEDLDTLVDDGPLLSQFLNLLDGMESLDGVLVIATTNRPDRIDPAIAKRPSRFDRVFLIPEPDRDLRRAYLERELGCDAPEGSVEWLSTETEGYSVAFLKELLLQGRLAAVREGREFLEEGDLRQALETTREHLRLASRGLSDRGDVGF
jgi:AAA+ superfamily predicted ATPase